MKRHASQNGMVLIATLFAVILLMTLLAVMVDIGTMRLRQSTQDLLSAQALAAADSGASWVRSLLDNNKGSISLTLAYLSNANSAFSYSIDAHTQAKVTVSVQLPGKSAQTDHLDINLQENPQIAETPIQITSTGAIAVNGQTNAVRTVTTLLRIFQHEPPFSEVVGVIDDAGPDSLESPGDPAGQPGGPNSTELRMLSYTQNGSSSPKPANKFENDSWFDGNTGGSGFLP